ncbi:MAG: hypothetical protein AB8B83_05370 [Bdellovibrionales bacterium]
MHKTFLTIATFSFLGGICGSIIMNSAPSIAAKAKSLYTTNFYNDDGKRVVTLGSNNSEEGALFLFNGKTQKLQIQTGAYPSGSEKGQSLFGMHDTNGYLRLLLRMHGPKDSPTVILKDNTGSDRIVFGLDGSSQAPYFRYLDSSGRMQNLIK